MNNREPIYNKQGLQCGYKGEMYSYLDSDDTIPTNGEDP